MNSINLSFRKHPPRINYTSQSTHNNNKALLHLTKTRQVKFPSPKICPHGSEEPTFSNSWQIFHLLPLQAYRRGIKGLSIPRTVNLHLFLTGRERSNFPCPRRNSLLLGRQHKRQRFTPVTYCGNALTLYKRTLRPTILTR
ncbi:hypothetical protein CDAR_185011 [Caerostris darwini]|uniref:Uncharacterized protein n=1 Tax=Caerostris darwini TaxID=1538125 RepID=A0AAV4SQC4_9ARAC|nr:hypothetical protein CDAR_185011 [Caerostris darwini]